AIAIMAGYLVVHYVALAFARADLRPAFVAAWTANVIFFGIGTSLSLRARTWAPSGARRRRGGPVRPRKSTQRRACHRAPILSRTRRGTRNTGLTGPPRRRRAPRS